MEVGEQQEGGFLPHCVFLFSHTLFMHVLSGL